MALFPTGISPRSPKVYLAYIGTEHEDIFTRVCRAASVARAKLLIQRVVSAEHGNDSIRWDLKVIQSRTQTIHLVMLFPQLSLKRPYGGFSGTN